MQPFDPIHSPLRGKCLIEAGAGTGKTYTITTLVLRLVLQEALPVEQILVVTFTTAATAELRDRLRRRLKAAQGALMVDRADDPDLAILLASCGPRETALERLEDALANFDRMPVFTIHGFCQRILREMAFETGSAFDAELVADASAMVQGLTDDFWRQTWTSAPPELMRFALPKMQSPDDLAQLYRRFAAPLLEVCPEASDPVPPDMAPFRTQWGQIKTQWRECRAEILPLLASPGLKANIYGSLNPSAGSGAFPSKREEKIQAWARMLDRWLRSSSGSFPLPEALVYLTQSRLNGSTKKGEDSPCHPFFEACESIWEEGRRLEKAMQDWLTGTHVRFFHFMTEGLRRAKQDKQALFFDDLLMMVREALQEEAADALKRMLQLRYRAVLIDEFQDTDPVQYDIFNSLFGAGEHRMFLIGDPKQAIYSFRGADIFTYLHAARHTARRFTLTRNWRSTPDMVKAVNTLFGNSRLPFLWPEIAYHQATAAMANPPLRPEPDRFSPLTVWFIDNPRVTLRRRAFNKQTAAERILAALTHEIGRIAGGSGPGQEAPSFSDVAVLVRTNRQAREVKRCLAAAAIPAVVYNAGSVFHQPEALDLRRLLEAVADPGNEKKRRTALATPFFGRRGDELAFDEDPPEWWSAILDRLYTYRDLWQRDGFMRMFRQAAAREKMAPRLLAGPGGERYLTNVLHLAELLHHASVERSLGMGELIQWLDNQRREEREPAETHQMRLESDDQAVTIMTVHKSKGLEFPIVFCPFAWEGSAPPRPPARCRHGRRPGYRLLDLGSGDLDRHLAQMAEEQMAEEIRLLYVAVTRAKERCYLAWGPLPTSEYSALAYLMADAGEKGNAEKAPQTRLQSLCAVFQDEGNEAHRIGIEDLARRSEGTIAVCGMPEEGLRTLPEMGLPLPLQQARQFRRGPMPPWQIASFSSLIRKRRDDGEILEVGRGWEDAQSDGLYAEMPPDSPRHIGEMAHFQAGPRAGLFLHDILEHIDFTASDPRSWAGAIDERMQTHGIDNHWKGAVQGMLTRVVNAPLEEGSGMRFSLRDVAVPNRLNELEFHLPLRAVDAASLARAFSDTHRPDSLAALFQQLEFSLAGGFLKGFVDLVFRHEGRFFIADWKSNHLGDSFDAYLPTRLADVMALDFYVLQYHIYVLALDRYLQSCCRDYDYERDFGGVFYFFIRGMGPPSGPPSGIFFDRPSLDTVQTMKRTLLKKLQ